MAITTHLLFRSKSGWDIKKSLPFNSPPTLSERCKDAGGVYDLYNKTGHSTLHRDVSRAIMHYAGQQGTVDDYEYSDFAIVKVSDTQYAAERKLADGSSEVVVWNTNGDIKAAKVDTTGRYVPFPTYGAPQDDIDSTTIFMALLHMMDISMTQKVKGEINSVDVNNIDTMVMYYLSDTMYQLIKFDVIKVNIPQDGNIDFLNKNTVKLGTYNGEVIKGSPSILTGSSGKIKSKSKSMTMKEAKKEFAVFASNHNWTEDEQQLIPSFPDDFPIPAEAVKIARRYIATQQDVRPMVNFMWRGVTSYGKSTGIETMACMLNMPLLRITCHSNMETQQFLSDFVPDTESSVNTDNLPDFETISYSPEQAYYQLTGIEDDNATPDMCLKAYGEAIAKQQSSTPRFKHVMSNYVKALVNGYIVEVQEVSRIKDSGVLVGLNEYDRPGAVIPLIDGSYGHRHPNSIVVFTDNVGYVSCRPVDPSVIRRMSFVIDSYELPKEQTMQRIKYNTKVKDKIILDGCYGIWNDLKKYCEEHDINEGSMSVSELEMLVQTTKYDGLDSVRDNIIDCIISKATADKD